MNDNDLPRVQYHIWSRSKWSTMQSDNLGHEREGLMYKQDSTACPGCIHPLVRWAYRQGRSSTPPTPSLHYCSGTSPTRINSSEMLGCTYKKIKIR
jgi:hypothetical protein